MATKCVKSKKRAKKNKSKHSRSPKTSYRPASVRAQIGNLRYFALLKRDNYRCQICDVRVTAIYDYENPPTQEERTEDTACEIDHIIPRSKGGPTIESNLQVTCRKCNREKGTSIPDDYSPKAA